MDHHTSVKAPSPTALATPQPAYVQPVQVVYVPSPVPTVVPITATAYPQNSASAVTLPVTGAAADYLTSLVLSAIGIGTFAFIRLRGRMNREIRSIEIL